MSAFYSLAQKHGKTVPEIKALWDAAEADSRKKKLKPKSRMYHEETMKTFKRSIRIIEKENLEKEAQKKAEAVVHTYAPVPALVEEKPAEDLTETKAKKSKND